VTGRTKVNKTDRPGDEPERSTFHEPWRPPVSQGIASRIRALRIRAGKSRAQMTQLLGLNPAWYADLEKRDEELASTLSMFKAMELASILGISLPELLDERAAGDDPIALLALPDLIIAHANREGISVATLERQLGWELREFLRSPVQMATEFPILFFQALGAALRINWLALIPDENDT
jgi:transcriptional regulator with XRE-family HTH domain